MNTLPILIKREFWEHRRTFLYLPLVIAGLCTLLLLMVAVGAARVGGDTLFEKDLHIQIERDSGASQHHQRGSMHMSELFSEQLSRFAALPLDDRQRGLNMAYVAFVSPLIPVLWLVVFMYFMACLYDDRKDRSILFWKSMPVSDLMTVGTKLVTGLVIVPGIYLGVIMVLHLLLLLVSSVSALVYSVDAWDAMIAPVNLFGRWFSIAGFFIFVSLWYLPMFSWVLLVSAWARSVPLAWVVGIPVALVVFEQMLSDSDIIRGFVARHLFPRSFMSDLENGVSSLYTQLLTLDFIVGLGLALLMIYGATYFRSKADEL